MNEQELKARCAMALNTSEKWIDERSVEIVKISLDGQNVVALSLATSRGIPFLMFAFAERTLTPSSVAREVFDQHRLLGMCVIADEPFSGWHSFRRNFATNQVEQVPLLQLNRSSSKNLFAIACEALDHRFEALLFSAHSILRDTDGLHPDEALDELCKVIDAKMLEEAGDSDERAFRPRGIESDEEVAADIRSLCWRSGASGGSVEALPRLSSTALAQVSAMLAPWSFTSSSVDIKGRAFQKLLGTTFRSGLGQFFTPSALVKFLVNAIDPTSKERLIDPFCGSGHFLSESLGHVRKKEKPAVVSKYAVDGLWGIDINDRMIRVARTDMRLHGDGRSSLRRDNSLLPFSNLHGINEASFDIVVTNPPFGSVLSAAAAAQLGPFILARGASTPLEVLGLERSVELLKPGGRLGIVLPEGILTNKRLLHVREWLTSTLKIRAIISFPREAFSSLGANISTCAILARKWKVSEKRGTDYPVIAVDIADVGYDAAGRPTGSDELLKAQAKIAEFIAAEGW